jgi:ADP-ribose pyrophosphatase YjhB (NUDIX family)
MRKQPFTYEEFKSIYSRVPRVTVDLIVKGPKGILLTLRESDGWKGQWHFPGGTVYLGETVESTVSRVAMEELGVEVENSKFLSYLEYPSEPKERGYGYSISLVFICNLRSEGIVLDSRASQYSFFNEIPEKIIEEQGNFLRDHQILSEA